MGIDTSIYQNLLRPVKSVQDYDNEAMQAQQNRLQLSLGQQKADEYSRSVADSNKLRGVVASFGVDQTANYNALLGAGRLDEAQKYQKSNAELGKTGAETAHLAGQTQKDKFGVIVQANDLVGSAAGAIMQNPDYNHAVGIVGDLKTKLGPELSAKLGLDTLQIPQDPAALKTWANDHYLGSIDAAKQLEDARVKFEGIANRQVQTDNSIRTAASSKYSADSSAGSAAAGRRQAADQFAVTQAASKVPAGYRANPDGSLSAIAGGPHDPNGAGAKPPTEFQGKSAGFGARAEQADKIISSLEGKYSPAAINSKQSVESVPVIGGIMGAATNKFQLNEADQKAEQAQRDFINAVLRQESGAAIAASEFDNAKKQYFPQPGDTKGVLAQKEANRKLAIQGFKNSAGKAAFSAPSGVPDDIAALLSKHGGK